MGCDGYKPVWGGFACRQHHLVPGEDRVLRQLTAVLVGDAFRFVALRREHRKDTAWMRMIGCSHRSFAARRSGIWTASCFRSCSASWRSMRVVASLPIMCAAPPDRRSCFGYCSLYLRRQSAAPLRAVFIVGVLLQGCELVPEALHLVFEAVELCAAGGFHQREVGLLRIGFLEAASSLRSASSSCCRT